jgi:hypothetical protein
VTSIIDPSYTLRLAEYIYIYTHIYAQRKIWQLLLPVSGFGPRHDIHPGLSRIIYKAFARRLWSVAVEMENVNQGTKHYLPLGASSHQCSLGNNLAIDNLHVRWALILVEPHRKLHFAKPAPG